MNVRLLLPLLILALLIVACIPESDQAPLTGEITLDSELAAADTTQEVVALDEVIVEDPFVNVNAAEESVRFTIKGVEGDLMQLKPEAVDPDGDKITYTFTLPFDRNGNWQTKLGDEGKYTVIVTASDGKTSTSETVLVLIGRANRAPVINCQAITVSEGDKIDLHDGCSVTDEDNAEIVVTYSGWMDSWRYQTTYDDAGTHTVVITASDKRDRETLHTVIKEVEVVVKNTNRAPVFSDSFPVEISAIENDIIALSRDAVSDPDGDKVTLTFSAPFDKDGVWKTKIGDAGSYTVDVVASDSGTTTKRTVVIKVGLLNTAPVLKTISDITVKEGETVKLPISATDREGDKLTVTISGWMTTDAYKTTYNDAGSYTAKVTVTDGEFTTIQVVNIVVVDVNRPPVFVTPA